MERKRESRRKFSSGVTPPIKVGDEKELKCISIGKKGDGIFKFENFVIIAPGVEVGKDYFLRITRVLPTIAFAELTTAPVKDLEEFGQEEE